jgi:hypothetical protein
MYVLKNPDFTKGLIFLTKRFSTYIWPVRVIQELVNLDKLDSINRLMT